MVALKHTLLNLPKVREAFGGRGTTAVYDDIKAGVLTPPLKQGRSSYWPAQEIDTVLAARIAGKSDDEIRQLVRELVIQRAQMWPGQQSTRVREMQAPAP